MHGLTNIYTRWLDCIDVNLIMAPTIFFRNRALLLDYLRTRNHKNYYLFSDLNENDRLWFFKKSPFSLDILKSAECIAVNFYK